MQQENRVLQDFISNPRYRERVIKNIHKEEDLAYEKRIRLIKDDLRKLNKARESKIDTISKSRWEVIAKGLQVNRTEGIVKINEVQYYFSSIQAADINIINGYRIESTEKSKSKKHVSVGGAVLGGMVSGPVGAVVGGVGLAKTKTRGTTISNQIPTCLHLGVIVNVNGRVSEIVLISREIDQTSLVYSNAYSTAQKIVAQLRMLSNTPVPKTFVKVEETEEVLKISSQIKAKEIELQKATENTPKYILPLIYRTEEQKDLSDEEYLQYLKQADTIRVANEQAIRIENKKKRKEEVQLQIENNGKIIREKIQYDKWKERTFPEKCKVIWGVIISILFWALSLFFVVFGCGAFIASYFATGIVYVSTAILINPKVRNMISKKWRKIPMIVIILITLIGFISGIMLVP